MRASSRRDIAPLLPPAIRVGADTLTASFLSGRNAQTLAAYRRDLEDFRAFLSADTPDAAIRMLISAGQGDANAIAHSYRTHLIERGLQAATVNRRLAAIRSVMKLANTVGLIPWRLSVESLKSQAYRDTRGPGGDVYKEVLAHAGRQRSGKAARDVAILRLLHDIGLRRGELVSLNLEDVDLERSSVMVKGKARTQVSPITLPAPTKAALAAWIADRGSEPGPLFTNLDRARKGSGRLTGAAIYQLVSGLGGDVGATVRPHGLRHLAITRALDAFKGDVRKVAQFSRHRDIRVLTTYDDNRVDAAGEVAAAVAMMTMEA
jgi:integrase/recombinase XerC